MPLLPPEQFAKSDEWKVQIDVTALKRLLGSGSLSVETRGDVEILYASYPNADKMILAQMMTSIVCQMIDESDFTTDEKLERFTDTSERLLEGAVSVAENQRAQLQEQLDELRQENARLMAERQKDADEKHRALLGSNKDIVRSLEAFQDAVPDGRSREAVAAIEEPHFADRYHAYMIIYQGQDKQLTYVPSDSPISFDTSQLGNAQEEDGWLMFPLPAVSTGGKVVQLGTGKYEVPAERSGPLGRIVSMGWFNTYLEILVNDGTQFVWVVGVEVKRAYYLDNGLPVPGDKRG